MSDVQRVSVSVTRNPAGTVLETVYAISNGRLYRAHIDGGKFLGWKQLPDIPSGELSWTRMGNEN